MISRFSLCLLALCILAVAPACAQTIVTHVPLYTFEGDGFGDFFGIAVSGAGDVDGDGFGDLIVGASRDRNGLGGVGFTFGSAQVFSGSNGSVLYNFLGGGPRPSFSSLIGSQFGRSVSGAGDVNGDGFDDVIVGAPLDDINLLNNGLAQVFSGSDGSVLYNFTGDSAQDRLGQSVSGAGDVNGDGFADLIVGAPTAGLAGSGGGSARVYSGVDGGLLYNFLGDPAFIFFGQSVSGAGDVNGDGFADLIVGAPFDGSNGEASGSAQVFSGADGSLLYNFLGDSAGDRFGTSVSGAGDVNGDGFADLIVRTVDAVQVFSGVDGSVLYNFEAIGTSTVPTVSDVGDVNGDGFDDVIVGSGGGDGAQVYSGADGSLLYNFEDDAAGDNFNRVSGAGDLNGDGLADFIVGAFAGGNGFARGFVSRNFILGDANQNGEVTFADIPSFIAVLQAGTFLEQADCNQDDAVTFADISRFIAILQGN